MDPHYTHACERLTRLDLGLSAGWYQGPVVAVVVLEYALRLPEASLARTRYVYVVPEESPVSVYDVVLKPVVLPIWVNVEHPEPVQRSIK